VKPRHKSAKIFPTSTNARLTLKPLPLPLEYHHRCHRQSHPSGGESPIHPPFHLPLLMHRQPDMSKRTNEPARNSYDGYFGFLDLIGRLNPLLFFRLYRRFFGLAKGKIRRQFRPAKTAVALASRVHQPATLGTVQTHIPEIHYARHAPLVHPKAGPNKSRRTCKDVVKICAHL